MTTERYATESRDCATRYAMSPNNAGPSSPTTSPKTAASALIHDGPTKLISTYDRAEALAHAMLLLAPDPSPEFWRCTSEPVLSVLLYTGSAGQRGGGLAWVNEAVATLAVDNGDAAGAVGISDPARVRVPFGGGRLSNGTNSGCFRSCGSYAGMRSGRWPSRRSSASMSKE